MLQQHPAPEGDTRTRAWHAVVGLEGEAVIVQNIATDLGPGESDTPETLELEWPEWVDTHAAVYGLTIEGVPIADHDAMRAEWRAVRRMANGAAPFTEPNVRDAFGAVLSILRTLTREIED